MRTRANPLPHRVLDHACHLYQTGKVFKKNGIAEDERLQQLLNSTRSLMPAQCKDVLHGAGYHCTRHEITNYRERQPTDEPAQDVSSEALLGALLQAVGDC